MAYLSTGHRMTELRPCQRRTSHSRAWAFSAPAGTAKQQEVASESKTTEQSTGLNQYRTSHGKSWGKSVPDMA
eukprot:2449446-Rhodomonas_salina.1